MRYIVTLLIGLIAGGAVVFLLFTGVPRSHAVPGVAVKPPAPGGDAPGTVVVSLDESFFDPLLGTIFAKLGPPSFQLTRAGERPNDAPPTVMPAAFQGGCQNTIVLLPENNGVKTGVRFVDGKITAPLVFSGSRDLPFLGCKQFKGWAQATVQLSFDRASQQVYGQLNVESVNLEGEPSEIGNAVTPFVQAVINSRVNPLIILNGNQLKIAVPIQASNGTLEAQVKDVHAEIPNGALKLHITYGFDAVHGGVSQPQTASPPG